MHYRTLACTVAVTLMAAHASAATIVLDDAPAVAASAGGWLDPGGTSIAAAPTSPSSRGFFVYNVMPGTLRGSVRLAGDDAGLISETFLSMTYTLYDVAAPPIAGTTAPDPAILAAVYADAGSGTVFGTATVTSPLAPVVVELNDAGLAALNAAATVAAPFVVGVTLTAAGTTAPAGTVPEPATWLLTIVGFGLVGAALRRRDRAAGDATPVRLG